MEPERRIEKWLRAFAKKRREQAGDPMELHPVTRQQLQKEIARRAAGTSGGGTWFSSFFLRPRLAFVFCFIALAVVGLILLPNLNRPKPSTLASANLPRDEMGAAKKTVPVQVPPPVSTTAPLADSEGTRVLQDKQPAVSGSLAMKPVQPELSGANRQQMVAPAEAPKQAEVLKNTTAQTEASTGITVASAPPSNKEMFAFKADDAVTANSFGGGGALSKDAGVQPLASTPPQAIPTEAITNGITLAANEERQKELKPQSVSPPTATVAFFDRSKSESAAVIPPVSQVFNRSDVLVARRRATDSLISSSPVLLSFRVEQTGNAMRVVDADGSVYTGAVQLSQQEGATRAVAPKNAPAAGARAGGAPPPVQNYSFRVSGTNRNLKQNVIFSGNLIPLTNAPRLTGGGGGFGGAPAAPRATELPTELLLSNSRISGTATIGDQKEIEVIATPAP